MNTSNLPPVASEAPPGWTHLIGPLIERCQTEGVTILQIKEKLGTLRFYVGSNASDELEQAILTAEQASARICQECGAEGRLRNLNGWLATLCDPHVPASAGVDPEETREGGPR